MKRIVCVGYGYCARALATGLSGSEWRVAGTSRSAAGIEEIEKADATGIVFNGRRPSQRLERILKDSTHLLVSAAPSATGDPVLAYHQDHIASAPNLEWIGYLSTIGVYGDQKNAWVDEATPVVPKTERAKLRMMAEFSWREFGLAAQKKVQIFRLAGIYGPGRSAIDKLKDGTAHRIVKPGQVFNRIHVDDIATVLRAAMTGSGTHIIYNVADDEPAPPQDVVAYAAHLLGVSPPPEVPFEEASLSKMGRTFYMEQRRVANARMKNDLNVQLAYPTYREGLNALCAP